MLPVVFEKAAGTGRENCGEIRRRQIRSPAYPKKQPLRAVPSGAFGMRPAVRFPDHVSSIRRKMDGCNPEYFTKSALDFSCKTEKKRSAGRSGPIRNAFFRLLSVYFLRARRRRFMITASASTQASTASTTKPARTELRSATRPISAGAAAPPIPEMVT